MSKLRMHTQECFSSKKKTELRSLKDERRELRNLWVEWQTLFLNKWTRRHEMRKTKFERLKNKKKSKIE
jgi:myosin-crossreactive antigen